jgi:hypothetical protein
LQNSFVASTIAIILFFFGENLLRPYIKSLIFKASPQNLKTTLLSVISGFGNLLKFPFIFVLSYLTDKNYLEGLWLMLFIKIVSLALVLVIFKTNSFVFKNVAK